MRPPRIALRGAVCPDATALVSLLAQMPGLSTTDLAIEYGTDPNNGLLSLLDLALRKFPHVERLSVNIPKGPAATCSVPRLATIMRVSQLAQTAQTTQAMLEARAAHAAEALVVADTVQAASAPLAVQTIRASLEVQTALLDRLVYAPETVEPYLWLPHRVPAFQTALAHHVMAAAHLAARANPPRHPDSNSPAYLARMAQLSCVVLNHTGLPPGTVPLVPVVPAPGAPALPPARIRHLRVRAVRDPPALHYLLAWAAPTLEVLDIDGEPGIPVDPASMPFPRLRLLRARNCFWSSQVRGAFLPSLCLAAPALEQLYLDRTAFHAGPAYSLHSRYLALSRRTIASVSVGAFNAGTAAVLHNLFALAGLDFGVFRTFFGPLELDAMVSHLIGPHIVLGTHGHIAVSASTRAATPLVATAVAAGPARAAGPAPATGPGAAAGPVAAAGPAAGPAAAAGLVAAAGPGPGPGPAVGPGAAGLAAADTVLAAAELFDLTVHPDSVFRALHTLVLGGDCTLCYIAGFPGRFPRIFPNLPVRMRCLDFVSRDPAVFEAIMFNVITPPNGPSGIYGGLPPDAPDSIVHIPRFQRLKAFRCVSPIHAPECLFHIVASSLQNPDGCLAHLEVYVEGLGARLLHPHVGAGEEEENWDGDDGDSDNDGDDNGDDQADGNAGHVDDMFLTPLAGPLSAGPAVANVFDIPYPERLRTLGLYGFDFDDGDALSAAAAAHPGLAAAGAGAGLLRGRAFLDWVAQFRHVETLAVFPADETNGALVYALVEQLAELVDEEALAGRADGGGSSPPRALYQNAMQGALLSHARQRVGDRAITIYGSDRPLQPIFPWPAE